MSVNISNNTSFLPYIEEEKHKNIVNKSKDKIGKFFQCKKWPKFLSEIAKHNIKKDKFVMQIKK